MRASSTLGGRVPLVADADKSAAVRAMVGGRVRIGWSDGTLIVEAPGGENFAVRADPYVRGLRRDQVA